MLNPKQVTASTVSDQFLYEDAPAVLSVRLDAHPYVC
jgi:hypothetical protein